MKSTPVRYPPAGGADVSVAPTRQHDSSDHRDGSSKRNTGLSVMTVAPQIASYRTTALHSPELGPLAPPEHTISCPTASLHNSQHSDEC